MSALLIIVAILIVLILLFIVLPGFRVVQQYERGVTFILGHLSGARGPGLFWVPPLITRMIKVDLRTVTMQVPPQEVITRDNVTIRVTAVVYFHVVNPEVAVINVVNFIDATMQIGQTTLRNVLGQSDMDELLAQRNKINQSLQGIIDEYTERWGIKVTAVEIKDIELPGTMQRAMARQAEAEREKRAKIIHAEGELQASTQLAQAASVIGSQPSALQLRYLQTLTEIAVEKNSTIIFPLPMDVIEPVLNSIRGAADNQHHEQPPHPTAPVEPIYTEKSSDEEVRTYEEPVTTRAQGD
ncbi:MAG TPA: slipin family protein [Dictyobacter sp.]|jgi:regulator of protease activity HflC (stomatin/prohibitin superfamily)|nr:slipin family protein [Dictyobacter sp.]